MSTPVLKARYPIIENIAKPAYTLVPQLINDTVIASL